MKMPFAKLNMRFSSPLIMALAAFGWLILISGLHIWLNGEYAKRQVVTMGYMPVITNLAAPLLDYTSLDGDGVRFKALKFSSFAEMAEALRNDQIQAAFMIAPLSIVLRQQGEDVKIIYIGNRHESTLVVKKDLNIRSLSQLAGHSVAVPMRYSGHNLCLRQLMEANGLTGSINIVEMNPPDMASAMAANSLDAYFVGEPFAAQTIKSGDAEVLYYVEDVWKNFICNLVLVRKEFIENNPEVVQKLVQGAARSGKWAKQNIREAARIASRYWNQPPELVEYALDTPKDRIVFDRFLPRQEEMQQIADLMLHFGLIKTNDISGLIDDRFAREVSLENVSDLNSILR